MRGLILGLSLALIGGNNALSFDKTELVAAVLIAEAGGESDKRAMPAVMEVISNRANSSKKSYVEIVLARKQFSCLNNTSPEKLIAKAKKHSRFLEAVRIVRNNKTNYTNNADHYHTIRVNPSWNKSMKKTVIIGNHIFYKSR